LAFSIPKHKYFIALKVYETFGGFFEARMVLVGNDRSNYPYYSIVQTSLIQFPQTVNRKISLFRTFLKIMNCIV